MSVDNNLFIQSALNGKDLSKPPYKLDEEILPLLKYLWERGIETNNSCASHEGMFKNDDGVGWHHIHPYIEVSIDANLSELKKKTESLSYRMMKRNSGIHPRVDWKGVFFINSKVEKLYLNGEDVREFLQSKKGIMTVKELIKENHEFLGNW